MAKIKLNGDTSGYIEISAPAVSGNNTLELGPGTRILTNLDNTFTGITTFSNGIHITSGGFILNQQRSDTHASLIIDKPDAGTGTIKFFNNGSASAYIQHTNAERLDYYLPSGSGSQVFYTNATERLRITSTGIVQIATDAVDFANGTGYITAKGSGDLIFRTTNSYTERLRITSNGNIGVGGATGTDYSLLDGIVTNTANGSAGLLINSSSSSHNAYMSFGYGSGSGTSHADQFSAYIGRVGDNTLILGTDNNIRLRLDPNGHLLHGVSSDEDTSGNGGLRFINSGDIQIDGDQRALVFRSTNNTAQLQSAIEWWNENGAGVQSKIACDRTAVSQAPSDLVFYTSSNVDLGGAGNDGAITEHLRITSAGETLISNSANRFLSLDRTNASSGSGEFNVNVENNSQASISYDDGAPLVIGTSSSPRTQAGFTERFRISSEGYVTKANHPSFRVGRHTDYNHTANQPLQFNTTSGIGHLNQGNHYSTTNHRFTAPVAGVYQFSACVIVNGIANNTDLHDLFYLMKNGNNMAYAMRRGRYVANTTGSSGYYVDFMSNVNVLMAANDYCDIRVRLSLSVHGNATYTWFSGTLVG